MTTPKYEFTQDWFSWAPPVWEKLIPLLPGEPGQRGFLEVGSFEGRSTVWMLDNMMHPGDWIDCVDTWEGGEEHSAEDMHAVEARFDRNIDIALGGAVATYPTEFSPSWHVRYASPAKTEDQRKRVYKYKSTSTRLLGEHMCDIYHSYTPLYDFIYIDGSHIAKDVLTDACMAWPSLNAGGIMVFDDYLWGNPRDVLHRPKVAVDAFINLFAEQIEVVHVGYQMVVRKKP